MARRTRIHLPTDTPTDVKLAPKHLTKQEFGKRLYNLMLRKGWHQSELSRQSGLPRDSISVYIRGRSLPTALSLKQLASALGVTPEELLPNHVEGAIDDDLPSIEFKVSPNLPDRAWLRVNRLVSVRAGLKIMEVLENDNAYDGSRGRDQAAMQSVEG
jgi:transcriptional regulator with XRE-family HTH domain